VAKRKDVSVLVSAAGWIGSFVGEIVSALRERGISDEQIHAFVTVNGKISVGKIAEIMAGDIRSEEGNYPITFNYSESIEDKVVAGKYDWSNEDITSEHLPTSRIGTAESSIKLFHFDQGISSEEVLKEMEKEGYRPAEACELLSFGVKHPDVQREFPIIALGSVWQSPGGHRYVVYLHRDGAGRDASLHWLDLDWPGSCRFAAVRK